ncbi:MAG: 3-keto-5-aminohexanoate cleavage protein [Deltaproteobacteria bacterium]|nr:3-keto-5-aminohexanoate cleavage protein [Deltaproteobacteria bacterium]
MGAPGGVRATPRNLLAMVDQLPPGGLWTAIAVGGRASMTMHPLAIALGGHVRVGFEDSIYLRKGIVARSNAELVKRVADLAALMGRTIAGLDRAKSLLGVV